jgi:16S rRNA (guanine1207-N2)-methyltransferase
MSPQGSVERVESGHQPQYFSETPSVASRRGSVTLRLPDLTVDLVTDRGVFSADAIDAGTRYLLGTAPTLEGANLVDLGCGYGPIAIVLATRVPAATVWAVEINERARALCVENARVLGLPNIKVVDHVPDGLEVDAIYSNPPIRIGKPALHGLLLGALAHLGPDGHAYLVVLKHLGSDSLQTWLGEQGWPTKRLGSRGGYRVLDATAAAPS